MKGKSLLPIFVGGEREGHEYIFWEHEGNRAVRQGKWKLAAKRWKLEYYFEEHSGKLYDRQADPHETNDLFNAPAYKEIRNELIMALLNWRSDLTDVSRLIAATGGGGPVARRIAPHTRAMKGTDSEVRLQEWVASIE